MKKNTAGRLAAMGFSMLVCGALLCCASARACTVFCYGQGDAVLAGRSLDIPDNPNLGMQLVPAAAGAHGYFCCGRFAYPWADGMNDQGLFVAVADVPTRTYKIRSSRQPADLQAFLSGLLANCASVDEAINWCTKQPTPCLGGWVSHSSPGDYTFITPQHVLVADRSGDSVVFEWDHGKLTTTRKRGRYQLMTNFLLCDPKAGSYPCPRYAADTRIFEKAAGASLQTCEEVLRTTSVGSTRYSLICDLTHGDVHVYLRRNFEEPKMVHLADELKKGRHELDLDQWFGRPKPELFSPPPVIASSTLPAAEVLQRALAARGGENAAATIRSIHGKGTIGIGLACLPALPMEYFAMRPNLLRVAIDFSKPTGPNLGQYAYGFDGRIGWDIDPNGSVDIHRGPEYEEREDAAEFFGWYDEPGSNETVECLGEAKFDGKLCYDLKVVSPSHHEYFHYYDTTNFLLAGTFAYETTQYGSSWEQTIFGDYRAFGGFLMPTRIAVQEDEGSYPFQFSSLEINTMTNIPPPPIDFQTYDKYVGQYRKSFLFGLVHLGPTLSITHVTDKFGGQLVASVLGLPAFPKGHNVGNFVPSKSNSFLVDPEITADNIRLTFVRLRNGKATRVIVNWNGRILSGARISDKPAG